MTKGIGNPSDSQIIRLSCERKAG